MQRLAQALAERLTQDVDSVLRDVQLWMAPPVKQRLLAPSAVSSVHRPLPVQRIAGDSRRRKWRRRGVWQGRRCASTRTVSTLIRQDCIP